MRIAFGLVGLLMCVGIIVYMMGGPGGELDQIAGSHSAAQKARENAQQIAGRDDQGEPVKYSVTLEPQSSGGHTGTILVTEVKAGGPYEKFWGLKRFDSIVEIGPLPVKDISSAGEADDMVMDAYQNRRPLTVIRDGNKMTLDPSALTATTAPSGGAKHSDDPMQRQLDVLQGIPH